MNNKASRIQNPESRIAGALVSLVAVAGLLLAVPAWAQNRLKDKPTATTPAGDDWLYLDGTANGTRKLAPTYFAAADALNASNLTSGTVPTARLYTSAAGYNITNGAALDSWAAVVRASGYDTFAASPTSANLRALLTDEVGTGAAVFSDSPTLVTPSIAQINAPINNIALNPATTGSVDINAPSNVDRTFLRFTNPLAAVPDFSWNYAAATNDNGTPWSVIGLGWNYNARLSDKPVWGMVFEHNYSDDGQEEWYLTHQATPAAAQLRPIGVVVNRTNGAVTLEATAVSAINGPGGFTVTPTALRNSSGLQVSTNNVAAFAQLNAAGNSYVTLLRLDASDRAIFPASIHIGNGDTPLSRTQAGLVRLAAGAGAGAFNNVGFNVTSTGTQLYTGFRATNNSSNSGDFAVGGSATGDALQNYGYFFGSSALSGFRIFTGGSTTPRLTVDNSGNTTIGGRFIVSGSTPPSSATDAGTAGTITWDANYIYICVATNTWKRVAISTW